MRALLFLAVFALATQVHNSEITEFYRTFLNDIPMDAQIRNEIFTDGLECINLAQNALISTIGKIQQDVNNKNLINLLRDAVGSAEVFEITVLPKCGRAFMKLAYYLQTHVNISQIDTTTKRQFLQFRLIQLMTKTVLNTLGGASSDAVAKDLAVLVDTAFGLIDANLPTLMEFDMDRYVNYDEHKALPPFLKGLFNEIGIYDSVKINTTAQCVLTVTDALKIIFSNPAIYRGDFYTRANVFLDSLMPLTDAFETCQRLDTVEMVHFKQLITTLKDYPTPTLFYILTNTALNLPEIMANLCDMGVNNLHGDYEQAGRLYAQNLKTIYRNVVF